MGLFGRKKRGAATDTHKAPATAPGIANDEILSVITAAVVTASNAEEHLAVIAVAIAVYEADNAQTCLSISKINRSAGVPPAWGVAGNREAIDVRRI